MSGGRGEATAGLAIRRYGRRVAKGLYWVVTPWKMPARIRFMQARAAERAREDERAALFREDDLRQAARARGEPAPAVAALPLFDDGALAQLLGAGAPALIWPALASAQVIDRPSAARFVIDLWRRRPDLRERFPAGPFGGSAGDFGAWLLGPGAQELDLQAPAREALRAALDAGVGARARQLLVAHGGLQQRLPHGLTPPGMPILLRWFVRFGMAEGGLAPEEVWWLFLEAAQQPAHELRLAYAFTPAWQALHPAALTVFGQQAFSDWFAAEYGAQGEWLDTRRWPDWMPPADQIRLAHAAHAPWRTRHPQALQHAGAAAALLAWLGTPEAALPRHAAEWLQSQPQAELAAQVAAPGVNVIGHFCYASGLRVSVESMVQSMARAGVASSLRDAWNDARDDPQHVQFHGMECHDVTVIHTQPEPFFRQAYARAHLHERSPRTYRIAYWYWEFDSIPDAWRAHAEAVDEVWAATEFVARGLRQKLSVPVRTLFPGVKLAPYARLGKAHFGLPTDRFTFLFTFHMMSVMERKNPLGLIRAFRKAFGPDDAAQLVLKTSFGDRHPAQLQALHDAAAGAHIRIIDAVYDPGEVLSLMDACDAYVSLHRSEGLGLTIAEAMLMGKPVIATDFSGNVDFMDENNSLPVPYRLVRLAQPIPPYDAGLEWAEPSIDHAAAWMRQLFDDPVRARQIGERGRANAEANLSLDAAGRRFAARLAEIRALRAAGPGTPADSG